MRLRLHGIPAPVAADAIGAFDSCLCSQTNSNPSKLFVYNTDTGKVVLDLPCVGVNDDMTFDTKRKRLYITGDGATSVFEQRDADHYVHIVDVPTGYRAKTSLYVPELNRLYINLSGG